jgi:hypothetical protein
MNATTGTPALLVLSWQQGVPSWARLLTDGETVSFRVLEALGEGRYLIALRQQRLEVQSRIPLEPGARYFAEAVVRQGALVLVARPLSGDRLGELLAQGRIQQEPLAVLLRALAPRLAAASGLFQDLSTPEAVQRALANCGLFYEAKLKEMIRTGGSLAFREDLKGLLLAQFERSGGAPPQSPVAKLLQNVEFRQLWALEGGPDGPVSFWMPFGGDRIVEGFVQRLQERRGQSFFLALRVPFADSEDVLVTVLWAADRAEIHFCAGPRTHELLAREIEDLREALKARGIRQAAVTVSRTLPGHLKARMGNARLLEAYA